MTRRSPRYRLLAADFGARLRSLREAQDIAATELADAVGLSPQTVFRLERGHVPTVPVLLALSIALGCSLVDLLPTMAHHR